MLSNKVIDNFKIWTINVAIALTVVIGAGNILFALPYRFKVLTYVGQHYKFLRPESISLHRSLSAIIGFILVILSYRLYRRVRMAWSITLCILPVSLFLHVFRFHTFFNAITLSEAIIILVLVDSYKMFNRITDPIRLKKGIAISLISVTLLLLYTAWGFLILKGQYRHIHDFQDSLWRAVELLFFMDPSVIEPKTAIARLYAETAIILNWTCLLASLLLVLKPLIYQPLITNRDRARVRKFLKLYGDNPISYVCIEADKKYYFGNAVKGVIAYVNKGGVAVCAGDPLCKDKDFIVLMSEFVSFCKQNGLDICFCQTTERHLAIFEEMGFEYIKYGDEAMFDLETYSISGGKASKVRQTINNANRAGIEVFEYKPQIAQDKHIENEIHSISNEWLSFKKSGELSFMLGSIGLDNPMDRRYFIARDKDRMQGFIVFTPFLSGMGYYADVTRRRKDAPLGVMEKTIITAFETMKKENVKWGSLGLAPLANIREGDGKKQLLGRVLEFIYENLNTFYGFKTLYQYKKKYNPTSWMPRYLVYYPGAFTPKIAYSILKAQNPKGASDFLLTQIKSIYNNRSGLN